MSDEERPTSSRTHKGNRAKDGIESETTSDDDASGSTYAARMFRALFRKLSITKDSEEEIQTTKVIEELTIEGLTRQWKEKGFTKIVTMVGAGISTSAGIPDFRSPGSGLYDNLQKYNLPHPTAVFEMDYFLENPLPFFTLAKELYPGVFHPTPSHYFVRLLHEKGLLVRHYTQNIDTLERIAGIPEHKLVEAHGSFYTGHCLTCHNIYTMEWMKEQIFLDIVPKCTMCSGIVKPDIIFFGENLPDRFYKLPPTDFAECDLLIIMGTSLEVQPFASLTDHVGSQCVRLLINRTKVGSESGLVGSWFGSTGLMFDSIHNTRDIAYIGDCDDGVWKLAEGLGWTEELMDLIAMETARLAGGSIDEEQSEGASSSDKGLENKLENKPEIPVERSVEPEQPIAKGTHSSRSSHKSAWSDRQLSPKKKSRSPSPSGRKSPRRKAQKNKKKP